MEEVYDIQQHPYLILIYIEKAKVCVEYYSTTKKDFADSNGSIVKDSCITYDKQKINIKSWGERHSEKHDEDHQYNRYNQYDQYGRYDQYDKDEEDYEEEEDDVLVDNFRDELYLVFKKDKDEWNEDDLFLLKAVSDFILLSVELLAKESKGELKNADQFHYLFLVPSDWEEEIRETLIRPILVQSNLISENDHNDRILFCSDIESIFYNLMEEYAFNFEKIRKTIFCRFRFVSKEEMLIKLDLVSTVNYLFDLPNSLLYPKVECTNQLSLTIDTFVDGIRDFIKDKVSLSIQKEVIQTIMQYGVINKDYDLKKPLITDSSRWELDKRQLDFIESICIFDICSQICENTTNNIDVLLSNDTIKEYNFLARFDSFSSGTNPNETLLNWSEYMLTYLRTYSRNENIRLTYSSFGRRISSYNMHGACRYCRDVINNANIYGKPQILTVKDSANSLSIFQESKPDAIMNIDISIDSTILSFSLLDENGFVKEIWNHNDFLKDKSLCSLGSFFNFSETTTTLNIKRSFIEFARDYLIGDISFFSRSKKNVLLRFINFTKDYLKGGISFLSGDKKNDLLELSPSNIETMLGKDNDTGNLSESTQLQIYIEAFVLLYMTYIKNAISSKLYNIIDPSTEIKIGYDVTVERILLNRLFCTKEGLRDIIYASGLIQKDDDSKKLRIITQGERIMYLLQRSLALSFSLKSYFVLAQLHENYIQLTLNQVVTEPSPSEEDQEAIIIHDRIINISNVYTSLCLNMWNNIIEDSSLIKLCDGHQEYNGDDLLEIFSLKNQAEFTENLKQYISKDNLGNSSSQPATDKIFIPLSKSCNCRVYLTVRDIIDVSFQPVLQDIVSLVSASFINKELFGNFWSIQYMFQLIHFDYNTQLHDSLMKMLKEITEDIIIEQGVDITHYVIPKSLNQLLHPVPLQQSISYKEFKEGTLNHVYSNEYGFGFYQIWGKVPLVYKIKTTDTITISVDEKTVFPLFKKGDIINDLPTNLAFYLNSQKEIDNIDLYIKYFKLKMPYDLSSDGTGCFDDVQEEITGPIFDFSKKFKTGQDIPFLISILYEAYSGSFTLRAKLVGQDISIVKSERLGAPMYLSRF